LAQEARGAAKILRQDVTLLTQPPPPLVAEPRITGSLPDLRVENTLNALDDAIGMLTELESGPTSSKGGRRGRIDLAALMCELSPNESVSIQPGAGTEVFGEEAELRRMLHVLFSQTHFGGRSTDGGAPVQIRREGEWVRISTELGPDLSASGELERRWLSRMATRMGGQLELEGGTLAVVLPADASNDQSEVADLRKELEQAQQLGEAYARELATVFSAGALPEIEAPTDSADVAARRFDLLLAMARALHRSLTPVFRSLQAEGGRGTEGALGPLAAGQEILAELGRLAACPPTEAPTRMNLSAAVNETREQSEARAARHGVRLTVDAPAGLEIEVQPRALSCLLRGLTEHAIVATPQGGTVAVRIHADGKVAVVEVTDGGAAVPEAARADLVEHRVDPASLGRPPGGGLTVAHAIASHLGSSFRLRDLPAGGLVVELRLPLAPGAGTTS
jgi:signal transduction histidine kinase